MNPLGSQIRRIRHQNADRHFDWAIIDPSFKVVDDPADHQTDPDATGGEPDKGEQATGCGRYAFLDQDPDSELQRQQPRGVVDEALSFEDVNDTPGKPDSPRWRWRRLRR